MKIYLLKSFQYGIKSIGDKATAESEIRTAVENLYNQKILGINSGKIYLKEWGVAHSFEAKERKNSGNITVIEGVAYGKR